MPKFIAARLCRVIEVQERRLFRELYRGQNIPDMFKDTGQAIGVFKLRPHGIDISHQLSHDRIVPGWSGRINDQEPLVSGWNCVYCGNGVEFVSATTPLNTADHAARLGRYSHPC